MSQSSDRNRDQEQEPAIPDSWQATLSVLLAVLLEVLSVEGSLVYGPCSHSIPLVVIVKMTCITLIFLPLGTYVRQNGLSALKYVRGRVTVVVAIVVINLAHNLWTFGGRALGY